MKRFLKYMAHMLGFEKLSRFEKDFLHDANLHSSMYIGLLTIVLEVWLLWRQTYSRVIPKWQDEGMDLFDALVKYTSKYWLFLLAGLGLSLFCMYYRTHKSDHMSKGWFFTLLLSGCACVLYPFELKLETFIEVGDVVTPTMALILNISLVGIYACCFLFGVEMVSYALMGHFKHKRVVFLEHMVSVTYCLICLFFGVFVSYSDFWDGKEIICFLMMMIYVGFMLMYRPYITMISLTACFYGFYNILLTFQDGLTFAPKEISIHGVTYFVNSGDTVNYITFLASLITICVAVYHGRLREAKKSQGVLRMFAQTAEALAIAIDAKDNYTHGHSLRVAEYSQMIAKASGMNEDESKIVFHAALLHDVGKIGVPDRIINKNGKLTPEEYEEIKLHPVYGYNILSRISESPSLSIGARYHHERYDGKGYPRGLKGEEIPELARIIAVADAYDAMTSARSYREPFSQERVREEIEKGIGTQFDPKFARVMLELIDGDTLYEMKEVSLEDVQS